MSQCTSSRTAWAASTRRYMISKLDMADRVLSLTTIGTPHRGSPFADWGVRHFERFAKPVLSALRIPHQAFYDLTTESCAAFNAETPDVPGVRYHSVAGRCSGGWLSLEWRLPHFIISRTEGPNDGMVSVTSATYGASNEVWDGDHMSLVNWPNPQALYARAVAQSVQTLRGTAAAPGARLAAI